MNIYHIGDHHFGHRNIIKYENRPFKDAEEMDEAMIVLWNNYVESGDVVIHYGDFSLCSPAVTIDIVNRLNGDIILINGNHDHRTRTFWEEKAGILKWNKRAIELENIVLSHWPMDTEKYNIHGHMHSKTTGDRNKFNVGVELLDYIPLHNNWFHGDIPRQIESYVRGIKNV